MKFDPQLTVLVASCDKYADILPAFSVLFRKYWPDCPFEVVLVTEHDPGSALHAPSSESQAPGVTPCFNRVIACGDERRWGTRLAMALKQITTPRVLMLCDDYFLCDHVDTELIRTLLGLSTKFHIGYLPMIRSEGRPVFKGDDRLAFYEKGHAYCIGTQAGIWDHEFLSFLANQNYGSIWEFERDGSFKVSESSFIIAGTRHYTFPFEDAVHKGCWESVAVRLMSRNGLEPDFTRRPPQSEWRQVREHLKGAILQSNPTLVVKVQNLFRLFGKH